MEISTIYVTRGIPDKNIPLSSILSIFHHRPLFPLGCCHDPLRPARGNKITHCAWPGERERLLHSKARRNHEESFSTDKRVRRSRLSGERSTGVRVRLTRCHANNARTLYVSTHLDAYLLVKARFDNPRIRGQYGRLLYPEDDEKSPSVTQLTCRRTTRLIHTRVHTALKRSRASF